MTHPAHYFVPVLTSEAGLTLTTANWQEAQVDVASFHLNDLLIKPGLNALHELADLAHYLNWPGTLVLNASTLVANREGNITIVSPYDGSKLRLTCQQLIALIDHLKPGMVLLPAEIMRHVPDIWSQWNPAIMPYLALEDIKSQTVTLPHGVYLRHDELSNQLKAVLDLADLPVYLTDVSSVAVRLELANKAVYLEADAPAVSAYNGVVTDGQGLPLDLKDTAASRQFEVINPSCTCCTCEQKLTKAYLHHLYHHTPLLCQRFLIQHNVHSARYLLEK